MADGVKRRPTSEWLLEKLTSGGRIDFRAACARLTPWESLLVQHVLGRADVHLLAESSSDQLIQVTAAPLSGLAFWDVDEQPEADVLAWLSVLTEVLEKVAEEAGVIRAREAAELREIDVIVHDWQEAGELDTRLMALSDWVERVETVYIFIGRNAFSKSDAGSNTLTRDELLLGLRNKSPESWRPADRLFVVAAHCLFVTGRSVRFEEFNGKQLSATALRQTLIDRYACYSGAIGWQTCDAHALPLLELAGMVRKMTAEVDRSRWMRYRRINGLTFGKSEYLVDFPPLRDPEHMPDLVAAHGSSCLGVALSGNVRADLRAMTLAAAALDADASPGSALSELLAAIVLSAVITTTSDYGMSSAIRDLSALRRLDDVLALGRADFFRCCLPHPTRMPELVDDNNSVSILWRTAQRMMFNRWHFIPGEFDRTVIPQERHYFFPPQVPDIAEHGEHHHGGHAAARVRYSIRAPGAQVWHQPFRVSGNSYRGCYDIRLVRMDGPPFTIADMLAAVQHCSLVDEGWRTVSAGVADGVIELGPVPGFDRKWYESRGWESLRPYTIAKGALLRK